ncbi:hypothetical protein [Hyphobacterium sp.]|uniref:hypothetical protein n=1 Tax=Hyphobacterium sp. TaxID=2004662 RepID=UPI003B52E999
MSEGTPTKPPARPDAPGSGYAYFGWILLIGGAALIVWGGFASGTVSDWSSASGRFQSTYNIGLLNAKLIKVLAGGALFVAGSVFVAISAIVDGYNRVSHAARTLN